MACLPSPLLEDLSSGDLKHTPVLDEYKGDRKFSAVEIESFLWRTAPVHAMLQTKSRDRWESLSRSRSSKTHCDSTRTTGTPRPSCEDAGSLPRGREKEQALSTRPAGWKWHTARRWSYWPAPPPGHPRSQ